MDYICYSKIIIHQKTLPVKIYEIERDLISTLLRQSKQSYFTNFFQDNVKNLKNT